MGKIELITNLYSSEEFGTILGVFDSLGPSLLSYPNCPAFHDSFGFGSIVAKRSDEQSSLKFPISYEIFTRKRGKAMVIGDMDELIIDSGTVAHEAHHYLNLCSSPFGYFLHLNRVSLNNNLAYFLKVAKDDNVLDQVRFPLTDPDVWKQVSPKARSCVEMFISSSLLAFVVIQRSLLGKLVLSDSEVDQILQNSGERENPLNIWYKELDSVSGSTLSHYLNSVKGPFRGPITMLRKGGVISELGGLQLSECLARLGEVCWLFGMLRFVKKRRNKTELERRINQCLSGHTENAARYMMPIYISQNRLGLIDPQLILFCCWMALMSPLDPRTLFLIKEYGLQWEDLHPGHRFIKILDIIKTMRPSLPDQLQEWKASIDKYHDLVANSLGWPPFEVLVKAMSEPHSVERKLYHSEDIDPFVLTYDLVNRQRNRVPWCDVLPGDELLGHDPLIVPVGAIDGKLFVSEGLVGAYGFLFFVAGTITELCLFGQSGMKLNLLLDNESAFEKACHVFFGVELDVLRRLVYDGKRLSPGS